MPPSSIVVVLPEERWPGPLLNLNMARGHSRNLARRVPPWRALGREAGERLLERAGAVPTPVRIWLEVRLPTNHRRDAGNLYPTAKALVDGVVDAGVLPGDHDGIVEGPWLHRTYPNGPARLALVLEPVAADELGWSRVIEAPGCMRPGGPDPRAHASPLAHTSGGPRA